MCNICGYPVKGNHLNWAECAGDWRARAERQEIVLAERDARLSALEAENAAFRERSARVVMILSGLRQALASHLCATADCDADLAMRVLEGRA